MSQTVQKGSITRATLALGAGGALAAGVLRYRAQAAEFSYKLALSESATHPATMRLQQAADRIARDSGGRFEIKIFPDSALGGDESMVLQARQGALELHLAGSNVLSNSIPVNGLVAVPFAFGGNKEAWAATDGPLGAYLRSAIEKAGLVAFPKLWDYGFRQMLNALRPINTPSDIRGLKIRIPLSPINVALFKALGASPVPINAANIYVSLQTHLVDGMDQPLISIEALKLYEVQKYVSITNHSWTACTLVANPDAWHRLPAQLREMAEHQFSDACDLERGDLLKADASSTISLKAKGMIFNSANAGAFKAAVKSAGLYGQWRDSFGAEAWTTLERAVGKLA